MKKRQKAGVFLFFLAEGQFLFLTEGFSVYLFASISPGAGYASGGLLSLPQRK